jgi:tetratricopeptide (TPR) repeat protein
MRLMAATLVPLFLLGLLELGLRATGYGYSTRFFIPEKIEGKEFLIPNRKFTHQFFPPALARTPLPLRMATHKPEGTYRIFLFGESAAYGDPDPSFGMGRFLEALLESRYPATDFEVVCVAITAINSHVILPIARDCAKYNGDLWVIYMGNNEMVGPFGAGTVFGQKAPPLNFVRSALALKATRVGQLIDSLVTTLRNGSSAPDEWAGIDMFSKNPLRHDDAGRLQAYENFRGNLEDILRAGKKAGVPVILSTVASNLKDCSPFASLHRNSLEAEQRMEWDRLFQKGIDLESAGSHQAALEAYLTAASIDPDFAELQFRIGTCQRALGNNDAAIKAFEQARDHDALAVRADTRINRIIMDAISAHKDQGVTGVDATEALTDLDPGGIPGQALFYEHVHLTMAGNYGLARIYADKLAEVLPDSITATGGKGSTEEEAQACEQRLAVTVWDQKRVWDVALGRISVPPFTSQSSNLRNAQYCKNRMKEVDTRTTPETAASDRQMYLDVLQRIPDDTQVRWNYAQFLERTGSLSEAISQGEIICKKLPHAPWPHYFTGSVMAREGRITEATKYLVRALKLDENLAQAQQELERIRSR